MLFKENKYKKYYHKKEKPKMKIDWFNDLSGRIPVAQNF